MTEPLRGERLYIALAEQLQVPLLQIARLAESGLLGRPGPTRQRRVLSQIELASATALRLVEAYTLSMRVADEQLALEMEPVSLSSVLHDTAHELSALAKTYNCTLELSLSGRYEPVMANRPALEHALVSLGYMVIESTAARGKLKNVLQLGLHRSRSGLVAGVFGEMDDLHSKAYRRARSLLGRARQPLPVLSATSGAGLFIADTLFNAQAAPMKVMRHHKRIGFGATFAPSRQLVLL